MAWEPSLCAKVIIVITLVILIWIVIAAPKEGFGFFKTPYPAQCPAQGRLLQTPSPSVPYTSSDDTVQMVPSRCSGNDANPFITKVYNRNSSPMTPHRRSIISELTGVQMQGPEEHMKESFDYSVGNYGDIILDSALAMYPKTMDPGSYKGMYV